MYLIIMIAIALSMDAFSVALIVGTIERKYSNYIFFASIVGIFHFFMPLLGNYTNTIIFQNIIENANKFLGIILLFIAITMIIDLKNKKEKNYSLKQNSYFIISLGVSIDSYLTGIGLNNIMVQKEIVFLLFSIFSFSFTFLGCNIGRFFKNKLGIYANIFGILILLLISVKYLVL